MSDTAVRILADDTIATLRAHEPELRAAGIAHLSLFGSVARGDHGPESDVDLAVRFDPAARMDLIRLVGLEQRIGVWLGREVQLVPEPVEKQRLQRNIDRDRKHIL